MRRTPRSPRLTSRISICVSRELRSTLISMKDQSGSPSPRRLQSLGLEFPRSPGVARPLFCAPRGRVGRGGRTHVLKVSSRSTSHLLSLELDLPIPRLLTSVVGLPWCRRRRTARRYRRQQLTPIIPRPPSASEDPTEHVARSMSRGARRVPAGAAGIREPVTPSNRRRPSMLPRPHRVRRAPSRQLSTPVENCAGVHRLKTARSRGSVRRRSLPWSCL